MFFVVSLRVAHLSDLFFLLFVFWLVCVDCLCSLLVFHVFHVVDCFFAVRSFWELYGLSLCFFWRVVDVLECVVCFLLGVPTLWWAVKSSFVFFSCLIFSVLSLIFLVVNLSRHRLLARLCC